MSEARLGALPPRMLTSGPGAASRDLARRLRRVESRNVTHLSEDFPVFWTDARGANVRDADGNVYVDLTGAFGVALTGHRDPPLVEAVRRQADALVHGMGDVHPPAVKVRLLERLAELMPWKEVRTLLGTGGSEAVEAALKTALLATGRPGIVAFEGGYHGLTGGALAATARPHFRQPFEARIYPGVSIVPFPEAARHEADAGARALEAVERALIEGAPNGDPVGAVVIEPVQGRAGVRVPPEGFLPELGRLAREHGALVVADEIFTGLGRTGAVLASSRLGLVPDLVCLGKALGGGLPLSACVGPAAIMDAWPVSEGEALHTGTFLGHPVACASALAFLDRLKEEGVAERAESVGADLRARLDAALAGVERVGQVRGMGLMLGVELVEPGASGAPDAGAAVEVAVRSLAEGVLVLPAGDQGQVVELTPPTVLTREQARVAVEVVVKAIRGLAA